MAGQIVKRGKRSWQVKIFMGRDANRKQKFHRKTIHGTKKDAQRYLNGVLRQMDLGIFVEPTTTSLEDYVKRWLRDAARPRVSSRTADGYKALLDRYIVPPLGHQRLDRIQPLDIQEVYGQMQGSGLSARVVRHTHAALHNALKQAVKWGLLSRNPSDFVELPKVPHKEYRVLSPEEAARFLKVAATKPHGLIFELALWTGMRPEEYLALQWSDIDLSKGTARIRRALVRHKKTVQFEEPKTARSRRTVYLPQPIAQKLKAHKRKQAAEKLKFKGTWGPYDLVFCSVEGTPLSIPNLTYRYFRPILTAAGLPQIRLYDLRHSCATLLLVAEENPKVVSERLGHSTVVLTLDTYSHVIPTMQQAATARLEKLISSQEDANESDPTVTQVQNAG
ncbi:MAG: site-specific integrase [Acidobacteria bacterium]|nr:MAG: site-specific integrase [Acidobacteriota bacterium]